MIIYLILLIMFFGAVFFLNRFVPTQLWWVRKFNLWRFFPKEYMLEYSDYSELRRLVVKLVTMRCANENIRFTERRNGYTITYYPEGVMSRGRFYACSYAEITKGDVTMYIGCRGKERMLTHIQYNDTILTKKRIFKRFAESEEEFKLFLAGDESIEEKYRDRLIQKIISQLL